MRMTLAILLGCAMLTAIASMIVGSYFGIRAGLNRRPGRSQRWYVTAGLLRPLFFKDELTPQGLQYRAKAFRAHLITLISIAVIVTRPPFLT
jgi:hypothetical protein